MGRSAPAGTRIGAAHTAKPIRRRECFGSHSPNTSWKAVAKPRTDISSKAAARMIHAGRLLASRLPMAAAPDKLTTTAPTTSAISAASITRRRASRLSFAEARRGGSGLAGLGEVMTSLLTGGPGAAILRRSCMPDPKSWLSVDAAHRDASACSMLLLFVVAGRPHRQNLPGGGHEAKGCGRSQFGKVLLRSVVLWGVVSTGQPRSENRMIKRTAVTAVAVLASLVMTTAAYAHAHASRRMAPSTPSTPDQVILWNQELQQLLVAPGAQPASIHPTRTLAITQIAVYDAVAGVLGGPTFLVHAHAGRGLSVDAAVAGAARTALDSLLPSQQPAVDSFFQSQLLQIGSGEKVDHGVRFGSEVAEAVLAARDGDGAGAIAPGFTPRAGPGEYQLTPPAFAPAGFTQAGHVKPFVLG